MANYPINYLQSPATIVNEALDLIGCSDKQLLGDLSDGTPIAECARRNYGQGLRELLRVAHWNFARRMDSLTLLGDATGQTSNVSTVVESPWTYAYAWPTDAVAARWMPCLTPQDTTNPPQTTGSSILAPVPFMPGRFLVSSSSDYPIESGVLPWDQLPALGNTEGVGPVYRRIILTDIPNALFVYTRLVTVIEEWDPMFRNAMDAMMALALIPVAISEPKLRMAARAEMMALARNAIADARVANGNDAGYPQSTDHQPSWITARSGGANTWALAGGGLSGYTYAPWDASMSWCGGVF